MKNLSRFAAVCAVLGLLFTLTSGLILAQDAKVFEGTLVSADANAHILVLKSGDKEMQFTYTDKTELTAPDKNGQPVAVKQGSKLRVQYQENGSTNVATRIEIMEP